MARWIVLVISVPLAVVCATSLIAWSMLGPGFELTERRPDKKLGSRNIDYVLPEPVLTTGPGIPSDWPGSWSCFRSDALNCAVCGSERRWIAAITSGEAITKILDHLELPSAAIQPSPPRAPPQAEFEFEGC